MVVHLTLVIPSVRLQMKQNSDTFDRENNFDM